MSTLHGRPGDLRTVRADELAGAARELGVARMELTGHPDGALQDIPMPRLAADVSRLIGELTPSHCWCSTRGVSPATRTTDRPRAPRCSPPAGPVSPCWAGPCRRT
jgi:hypothetical protein